MRLQPNLLHLLIRYFHLGGVFSFVQLGLHPQTLTGGGLSDQLDNDFVTDQRPSPAGNGATRSLNTLGITGRP
jgi:hypothetical protein